MVIDSKQYDGLCACGKTHKMETKFCIIESGCLNKIGTYMKHNGIQGYTVAVYDENTYRATADRHPPVDTEVILPAGDLHANEHGVALLSERLPKETEIILAIGAGTVHDISRYCAYERNIPFVSCPTAASVDGFCSSVAAMTWNGCKKTLTAVAPRMVVADLDVIRKAPIRLAKSGFGDMVGKYIALTDWKIAHILTKEYYCETIARMTLNATQEVIASTEGILALEESAYEKLMYGLLLSGIAMQMTGNSRPASGAEHHISHLIEMKPEGLAVCAEALHGEKVGVGTLLIMEHYQQLLTHKTPVFHDYIGEPHPIITHVFGTERAQDIIEENRVDAAESITDKMLGEKWSAILRVLSNLPNIESIKSLYDQLNAKTSLPDIGVSRDQKDFLLKYAPLVRNRLTLLRLLSRGAISSSMERICTISEHDRRSL